MKRGKYRVQERRGEEERSIFYHETHERHEKGKKILRVGCAA